MLLLFGYYNNSNKIGFKSVLSSFISHNDFWYKDMNKLISVGELNNLDRKILVEKFYKYRTHDNKYSIHGFYTPIIEMKEKEVKKHIEEFIDLVIPRHYFVLLEEQRLGNRIDRSEYRKKYKNILDIDGLKFIFEYNYEREGIINFNKREITKLSHHYKNYSDDILYEMVFEEAENSGYQIIKEQNEIEKFDLLRLLKFFEEDREMADLFNFVQYKLE